VNAASTLSLWMETVGGGFAAWEFVSVALLFVRWVASHLPAEAASETSTNSLTPDATADPVAAG
jgi:hypothetical protein